MKNRPTMRATKAGAAGAAPVDLAAARGAADATVRPAEALCVLFAMMKSPKTFYVLKRLDLSCDMIKPQNASI
jgi:hypothetical protein